jgi:DNA primase
MKMNDEYTKQLKTVIDICHMNLAKTKTGKEYLIDDRKLSKEICSRHKLGFFPSNISKLCEYVSEEFLVSSGLINLDKTSQFANYYRIIFPIYDEYGAPVGLAGRTMLSDDERQIVGLPKYRNTTLKKTNYLFGLNLCREEILLKQNVFVVEGYFDQISMVNAGIKNTVAVCGTAFTKNHFVKLSRYTDKITFFLDRDDGGKKSTSQIFEKFVSKGIKLRFITLPDGYKDAGEYFLNAHKSCEDFNKEVKYILPVEW